MLRYIDSFINNELDELTSSDALILYVDVQESVNKLKSGKSDRDKGHMSDHLNLASERLHRQIAMLVSAMLIHGHQPEDLLLATITSIPKDNQADIYIYSDSNSRHSPLFLY